MNMKLSVFGLASALSSLVWLAQMTACTGDDAAAGGAAGTTAATGGTSAGGSSAGAATGGASGGSAGSGGSAPTSSCKPIPSTKPGIADFETYDGSVISKWSFAMGADSSTGIFSGPFGYGDREGNVAETFEMAAGHASTYAMHLADSMPNRTPGANGLYGGGMGLWLSGCVSATAFSGISFWVKGDAPNPMPNATFTMQMLETLPVTPATPDGNAGTCAGDDKTCLAPTFEFPVTSEWVQIKAAWSGFKAGSAAGTAVVPDGKDIVQVQWAEGLVFAPPEGDAGGAYVAVPAAYELLVDDIAFY